MKRKKFWEMIKRFTTQKRPIYTFVKHPGGYLSFYVSED